MLPSRDLDLEAIIAVQATGIAELHAANAALHAQVAELQAANAALQTRVAELERRLGQDSSNSSKPPSQDGLRKPAQPLRGSQSARRPGKQPGAPGMHLVRVADPDEVLVRRVREAARGNGPVARPEPRLGPTSPTTHELPYVSTYSNSKVPVRPRSLNTARAAHRPATRPPPHSRPIPASGTGSASMVAALGSGS